MINRHAEHNKRVRAERMRAYLERSAAFDEALRGPQRATVMVPEPAPQVTQATEPTRAPAPAPAAPTPPRKRKRD